MAEQKLRYCFGDFELLVSPASTTKVQIFLAGVGNVARQDISFDFLGVGERSSSTHHCIHIKDNSRSWYNSINGWSDVVDNIQGYIARNNIDEISIIGVSMGGYGAFILAKSLPASHVVAFAPRTRLYENDDFDTRNRDLIRAVNVRLPEIKPILSSENRYHVIFSIDEAEDTTHAARLAGSDRVQLLAARGGHNVAQSLARIGVLSSFLTGITRADFNARKFSLTAPPPTSFALAEAYLKRDPDMQQIIDCTASQYVPRYLSAEYISRWMATEIVRNSSHIRIAAPLFTNTSVQPAELGQFLVAGWSHNEGWGIWADGRFHIIRFIVPDVQWHRSVIVRLTFSNLSIAGVPVEQHVIVSLNGIPLADQVTREPRITLICETECNFNEIRIETPNAVAPRMLGGNNDSRRLSIALLSISVVPSVATPT